VLIKDGLELLIGLLAGCVCMGGWQDMSLAGCMAAWLYG
jgi:hypothetical protein